jgi:hypothetical protein
VEVTGSNTLAAYYDTELITAVKKFYKSKQSCKMEKKVVPKFITFPSLVQVYVHQTLHAANQRSLKRGGRVMAITPRHFLDFINHFVKLYAEKRAALVTFYSYSFNHGILTEGEGSLQ